MSLGPQKSVLIVAGGDVPEDARLKSLAARYESIIAADSGLESLEEIGLVPDYVTGDFDSVAEAALESIDSVVLLHDENQENTDLEKAILLALRQGAGRIGLVGASGSRLDHTINAVSLMIHYREHAEFIFHDAGGEARLALPPAVSITGRIGQRVSLVPAPAAHDLSGEGFLYPIRELDLVLGGRDAISNELVDSPAVIRFASGAFLVYLQDEEESD
jgi:thiamine pyrophosphokinase